jgi:hypothetical protein
VNLGANSLYADPSPDACEAAAGGFSADDGVAVKEYEVHQMLYGPDSIQVVGLDRIQ